MSKVNLSAPWVNFYREIEALFKGDPEIRVTLDLEANEIKLYVDNSDKAEALGLLLPMERTFGNVTFKLQVVPENSGEADMATLIERAFRGNRAFIGMKRSKDDRNPFRYAVFRKCVVQYFNDDLGDVNGNRSTLYQEIARDVFGQKDGVSFCTYDSGPWE